MVNSSDAINNYVFKLCSNTSSTGGLGEYKNVIGIQLVKLLSKHNNVNIKYRTTLARVNTSKRRQTPPNAGCLNDSKFRGEISPA